MKTQLDWNLVSGSIFRKTLKKYYCVIKFQSLCRLVVMIRLLCKLFQSFLRKNRYSYSMKDLSTLDGESVSLTWFTQNYAKQCTAKFLLDFSYYPIFKIKKMYDKIKYVWGGLGFYLTNWFFYCEHLVTYSLILDEYLTV